MYKIVDNNKFIYILFYNKNSKLDSLVKTRYKNIMNSTNDRKFVGRLIYEVLTERKNVREAIKLFPETKDVNIECAYHALVHFAADEEMRYKDIEYKEAQDDYLEFLAQTLSEGKYLPKNIIEEYKPYYKGISRPWEIGLQGFLKEFKRFINI